MSALELITRNESVLEQFAAALDAVEWKYSKTEKRIEFRFPIGPCIARGFTSVAMNGGYLLIFASIGLFIPEQKRSDALKILNRLNWKMAMANYEMDESDGEIRIRTAYPLGNGQFDADRAVETMLHLCATADDDVYKFIDLLSSGTGAELN